MRGLLAALCLVPFSAHAVLIGDKDWATFGSLTGSNNYRTTAAEMAAQYDATTGLCKLEWCGFGAFGESTFDFTDYVWASTSEVNALFQSFDFGLASNKADHLVSYNGGNEGIDDFFNTLFPSAHGLVVVNDLPALQEVALGWTRTQSSGAHLVYAINYTSGDPLTDYAGLSILSPNLEWPLLGLSAQAWLYKPTSVPEPETYALLLLGGLAAYLGRRRRVS